MPAARQPGRHGRGWQPYNNRPQYRPASAHNGYVAIRTPVPQTPLFPAQYAANNAFIADHNFGAFANPRNCGVVQQQQDRHVYTCSVGGLFFFITQEDRSHFIASQNQVRAAIGFEDLDPQLATYFNGDPQKLQITQEHAKCDFDLRRERFATTRLPWDVARSIPGRGLYYDTVYFEWRGYPPSNAVVPQGMSCYEVCFHYPNSLFGQGLDAFIQLNFTAPTIIRNLPDDIRRWLQIHPRTEGWLAKRLNERRNELIREGLLDGLFRIRWAGYPYRDMGRALGSP